MKIQLAACVAIFATSCDDPTSSTPSSPDPAPPVENPKSPELQVLDRFVGTWDIIGSYTPAGGEKIPTQSVALRKWSTNGTTLHREDPSSGPDDPGVQGEQTYDPEKKNYPGVGTSVLGNSEFAGTWDEKTRAMSFKGAYKGGGPTFEGSNRFIDADTISTKIVFKNPDGELLFEVSSMQARRKALGEAPSVEQLLASYHEAIGGLEANKKVTTRRIEGTITMFGMEEPAKLTVIQKAPDLGLTKFEGKEPISDTKIEVLEGHDGKVVWRSIPVEGTVELEGDERAEKARDYQFHRNLDLKADFKTLTSKGRETLKGTTYDVLEAVREDGSSETLFFHAWTHHLSIVKRTDATIEMSSYQESGGVFYPGKTTVAIAGGPVVMNANFTKVEHGIEVDDAIFNKPKE